MAKILTDEIIPELKGKIPKLKFYHSVWSNSISFNLIEGYIALVLCSGYSPFSVWHNSVETVGSENAPSDVTISVDNNIVTLSRPTNSTWAVIVGE